MATPEFKYQPMFEHGKDTTEYYLLTKDYVSVSEFEGKPILKIEKEGLTAMANAAFRDVSFMLRRFSDFSWPAPSTPDISSKRSCSCPVRGVPDSWSNPLRRCPDRRSFRRSGCPAYTAGSSRTDS